MRSFFSLCSVAVLLAVAGCGSGQSAPAVAAAPAARQIKPGDADPVQFLANMKRLPAPMRQRLFANHPDLLPKIIARADPATAAQLQALAGGGRGKRGGAGVHPH